MSDGLCGIDPPPLGDLTGIGVSFIDRSVVIGK